MENNGWIKLFRKFNDWGWYGNPNVKVVFIHFLLNASLEDKEWNGIIIKRGELPIGRKELSKTLGISEQSIRTSITKLKSTSEITSKQYNHFTLITINKFDEYQQSTSTSTSNQPATNQQLTTSKEYKNIRIINIYQEKINKNSKLTPKAKSKIESRLQTYTEDELIKAIDNFSQDSWWMENNSNRGIAWFFNSDDRIEQLINLKPKNISQLTKPKDFNSLLHS
jgi:biotin operon repressor